MDVDVVENAKDEAVVAKPDDASEPYERGRSLERLARERCGRGARRAATLMRWCSQVKARGKLEGQGRSVEEGR